MSKYLVAALAVTLPFALSGCDSYSPVPPPATPAPSGPAPASSPPTKAMKLRDRCSGAQLVAVGSGWKLRSGVTSVDADAFVGSVKPDRSSRSYVACGAFVVNVTRGAARFGVRLGECEGDKCLPVDTQSNRVSSRDGYTTLFVAVKTRRRHACIALMTDIAPDGDCETSVSNRERVRLPEPGTSSELSTQC